VLTACSGTHELAPSLELAKKLLERWHMVIRVRRALRGTYPFNPVGQADRSLLRLNVILVVVGSFFSVLLSPSATACETVYSVPANSAQYEYDPVSGRWQLVASWSNPGAMDYVPQPGDQYEVFESQGLWVLYVSNQSYAPPGQPPNPPPGGPGLPNDPYGIGVQCDDDSDSVELPRYSFSVSGMSWSTSGSGSAHVFRSGGGAAEGPVRLGRIVVSAQAWLELAEGAQEMANVTYETAIRDIISWRDTGMHVPHAPFSWINWNRAQVDWGLYGLTCLLIKCF